MGSGSYHLAVQFVKLSAASAAESGQEFSTILWIEDAGLESSPLSPNSPHGLAGPHNSFRSSRFSTSSSSSSLSSLVPSYTPAPSYIVRTSSHLLHTLLLQPQNATHSSRYNSGSPTPQPHHTATLALPMCTPPTSTIHQLVDHLLSLTTTTQGTKTLSRRLNSLITQFTPAGGGVSASSALARFGTDLFGGTASETASVNSHGGGGGGGSGLPGTVTDGVLGGEDWYDDADDRGVGNGGTGVRSWLKSKRTIIVHRASVRTGHGAAAQAGRRKSETFEAASFITPVSPSSCFILGELSAETDPSARVLSCDPVLDSRVCGRAAGSKRLVSGRRIPITLLGFNPTSSHESHVPIYRAPCFHLLLNLYTDLPNHTLASLIPSLLGPFTSASFSCPRHSPCP